MQKRIATTAIALLFLGLLSGCSAVQDGFRYLDEGPRNYHGAAMQRYWDHSLPGQRQRW